MIIIITKVIIIFSVWRRQRCISWYHSILHFPPSAIPATLEQRFFCKKNIDLSVSLLFNFGLTLSNKYSFSIPVIFSAKLNFHFYLVFNIRFTFFCVSIFLILFASDLEWRIYEDERYQTLPFAMLLPRLRYIDFWQVWEHVCVLWRNV